MMRVVAWMIPIKKAGRVAILWLFGKCWCGRGKKICFDTHQFVKNSGLCQIMEGYHINDVLDICIQAFRKGLKPGWYYNVFQV